MSITKNNKIEASDISTALNNKQDKLEYTPVKSVNGISADEGGDVVISISSAPEAYIIETWSSNTGWYRKWSNGWIEQGGRSAVGNHVTVTFPKAMSDSGYTALLGPIGFDNAAVSRSITNQTTTSLAIKVGYNDSLTRESYWYVCGY